MRVLLNNGLTSCALLGKYCTETVFASAGIEAPENEYIPQPLKRQQDNKTTRQQDMTYIDLSNFKSGIYFVKIKTKEGNIVKRIVKN